MGSLAVGDLVRCPSGKVGPVLSLGQRLEWDGQGAAPRAVVLIPVALSATSFLQVRAAYHPDDLVPAPAAARGAP